MGRPWTTKLLAEVGDLEVWTENDYEAWWVFKDKTGPIEFVKDVDGFWYYSPSTNLLIDTHLLRGFADCLDKMNKEMDEAYAACVGVMFDEDSDGNSVNH